MSKYIDADLLRKEIERRMKIYKESNYGISLRYQELEELLTFLDTLQEPSLPSDVDEAAEQAMPISYDSLEVDIYGGSEPVYSYEQMVEMFKAGVAYGRAKMLEEAVEGEVYLYESYKRTATAIVVNIPKENLGDKVRIAILKDSEDEK